MKKILALTTALIALSATGAQADSLYIGIGQPQPTYIAPPPAYVVQEPVPYYHPEPVYYDRHHHYNWRYWHGKRNPHDNGWHGEHRGHDDDDRDHDHDRGHH